MNPFYENLFSILFIVGLVLSIFLIYLLVVSRRSRITQSKIEKAKESGFHEPVSLHPVINAETCIGSGACIEACPEKDILGWANGRAKVINASRCVGHGACFHACPVQAITLCIGTEKRGVELPHISQEFETNIPMLYIAGELGGMGLIKNAVVQGKQAVEFIARRLQKNSDKHYDVIIIGAGPAGISATLTAAKNNLKYLTLEQDTIGGTVFNFPRRKIIMTSAMDLPLYGKLKLKETTKPELINLWSEIISKNEIVINQQEKVLNISKSNDIFEVESDKQVYSSYSVILAIGRRGSPRKLGVPGEEKEKVFYRLLDPELYKNENILVVGGGDSAIESALLLADENNNVTISYRSDKFVRLKPKNLERIQKYSIDNKISVLFNSSVKEILDNEVILLVNNEELIIPNNIVYIFAGGELPNHLLEKIGVRITKKFGDAVLFHKK
ncbi:MAG: 4Fe-4S dicluster domain-containing protein [Ignavibacteriales bacterium]|nr:MAG: 4Fe-4S dicluster domain-containing protein [Ignavibacteriales bacterium]